MWVAAHIIVFFSLKWMITWKFFVLCDVFSSIFLFFWFAYFSFMVIYTKKGVAFFLQPFEALTQNGLMVHHDSNPVFYMWFKVSHIMHGTKLPTYYHTIHRCIFWIVSSNSTNMLFDLFHKWNIYVSLTPLYCQLHDLP